MAGGRRLLVELKLVSKTKRLLSSGFDSPTPAKCKVALILISKQVRL
jgi:hypothetical protein